MGRLSFDMRRFALPLVVLLLLTAQIPRSLYDEGIAAMKARDFQKANDALSRAAALEPRESEGYYVHYWLGIVRSELGDHDGALKELRESARQGVSLDKTDVTQRISELEQRPQAVPIFRPRILTSEKKHQTTRSTEAQPMPAPPPPPTATTSTAPRETTTAATTTVTDAHTGPDASIFDEIDRRFAELSPGEIVFTAPDRMRVADTSEVDLRIAAKNRSSGILEGLTEGVTSTAVQEHITPVMEAHLDGGSGLDIVSVGKDSQSVAGGGFAEWRWNVTPKRSGSQRLTVSIIAHLTYPDGRDIPKTIRTMTRNVAVSANVGDSMKTFFASYWQWLTTTLIIPIVIFFYRRRANRDNVASASGTPSANATKK